MNTKAIERRKKSNQNYLIRQDELLKKLCYSERNEFEKAQSFLFSKKEILNGEFWVPIIDWEDLYEISNYGRIRSKKDGYIKTPHLHHSMYYTISLHEHPKRIKYFILSRLLAINFIENPFNLPEVNHKNKIRIDCRLSNLEWTSSKQNSKHKSIVECSYNNKIKVVQLSMSGEFIKEWDSITDAAIAINKKPANIGTVCRNKNHYAYGFIWMYKEDYTLNGIKNRLIYKKYKKIE